MVGKPIEVINDRARLTNVREVMERPTPESAEAGEDGAERAPTESAGHPPSASPHAPAVVRLGHAIPPGPPAGPTPQDEK